MRRGRTCPECGQPMDPGDAKFDIEVTWVIYVCRNGRCSSVRRGYPAKQMVLEEA